MDEVEYSALCSQQHQLYLVSEGYAYCKDNDGSYYPWSFSRRNYPWVLSFIFDLKGQTLDAWVGNWYDSKADMLEFIVGDVIKQRQAVYG